MNHQRTGGISLTSGPTFSASGYQAALATDKNGRQALRTRARRGYAARDAMLHYRTPNSARLSVLPHSHVWGRLQR